MLSQISRSTEQGKLNFSGTQQLLKKYGDHKNVQQTVERHAYQFTVMASMLEFARLDGVLASADFLWLKPVDRKMWYMLNSIGRQTAFSEVAGAFCHWQSEKELGKKINVPMVKEAVTSLDEAINNILYVPDEED